MEPPEVKQDGRPVSIFVSEAASRLPNRFDPGVDPFYRGIGDPMLNIVQDAIEMVFQGLSRLLYRGQPRVSGPEVPLLPKPLSPRAPFVFPEISKVFLDGPGPGRFQVTSPHEIELGPVLLREIFPGIKPDKLGSCQGRISFFSQPGMLFLVDLIDGLSHMDHEVVAVEDDLVLAVWQTIQNRVDIGLGHVHAHGLDPIDLFIAELIEVTREAFLAIPFSDLFDNISLEITDDRDVILPATSGFFIHSVLGDHPFGFSHEPALNCPFKDVPGLVPADTEDPPGGLDAGSRQDTNREALEQHREPGVGLSPWELDLTDAVLRTLDPGRIGMEKGLKLTAVQMTPDPLSSVIVERPFSRAFRAGPLEPFGMLDPDINPLLLDVQFNSADAPRGLYSEQMPVQGGIAHDLPPF